MFRLSILKNFAPSTAAAVTRVTLLAFIVAGLFATDVWAQSSAEPRITQGGQLAEPKNHISGCQHNNNNPYRYFFEYTDGDFDSGSSHDFNLDQDSVDNGCVTFLDGDDDLDADFIHLSCSTDYTADPTAVGNGLTVKNWFIEWDNGKRCGDSGIVTIEKEVEAGSDQSQEFEFDGPDGASYSLSHGESQTFLLPEGTYTVSELVPAGWELTDLQCVDPSGNTTTDLGNAEATIHLDVDTSGEDPEGEDITCTFTNAEVEQATITVRKVVTAGSTSGSFGFTGDLGSFSLAHNETESFTVDPDTYTINETVPDGWTLDSASCDDTGSSDPRSGVTVADGDDITCTFSNSRDQGTIIVRKETIPSPDASGAEFGFTGPNGNTYDLGDGEQESFTLFTGSYSVDETTIPDGWEFTSASCTGDDDGSDPSDIQLDKDETVTCTFTNTQQGQIIIAKETDPDGDPQVFTFSRSWNANDFTLTDGGTQGSAFLSPGNYSATETVPEGWVLDSIGCDDTNSSGDEGTGTASIVLDAGETVTCTFNNRKLDPGIEIVKTDSTDPVAEGGLLDYTLTYSNTGELELTGVTITDDVPANTTFNGGGADAGSWDCSDGDGPGTTCTFNVGTLGVDDDGLTVNFPLAVDDDLWEPDEETGLCGEEPEFQVDNTGNISGSSVNGDVDDSDSESTEIEVSCEDNPATLTVVKEVSEGDETQSFDFTGSSSEDGFDSFSLTGESGSNSASFELPGGNYTVSETVPAGWELESATCDQGDPDTGIDLAPGDEVTCTFTNRELESGLSVIKRTNGNEIREGFCDEGTLIVGEPVEWTYAVTNTGEQPLEITSITDDAGSAGEAGDDFTPTFVDGDDNSNGVLDPGETWNYQASGTVETGEYSNVVTVEAEVQGSEATVAAKAEPGTLIESSDVSGYCGVQPDLAIEKTDGDLAFVPEGTDFAYTLTFHNLGTVDVTGVVISETVPEHTTFNADGPDGALWTCTDIAAGSTCTHEVGALAAGASGSVQFPLTVDELVEPDPETGQCPTDPPSFVVDNTGTISDDGTNGEDSNPDNNSDSDTTPVLTECEDEQLEPPAIDIEKDPDSQLIEQGETADFTITVTNTGPVTLFNVVVTDPQSPDCDRDIGTMEPGAVVSYDCERLNVRGNFTNVATATGDDGEGNDVSDEDSANVNVLIVDEPPQEIPIPTLSQWALILMAGLMLLLGGRRVRVWTRR